VGEVVRLSGGTVTLQDAADAFLDHHDLARSTRRVYRAPLASLVAELGPATAVGELSGPRVTAWFGDRHATAAPATWNRELATLRAAAGWWRRRGWLAVDPTDGLERGRERVDRTRALTRGQVERLFARRDLPLRERTLWRLLYETAARANELLALDVEDLDLANRRPGCTARAARSSWAAAGQAARWPASTWTRPASGPGCRTGVPPNGFTCAPGGRCTSCAIRPSPTLLRMAPTCRCCWPAPGTPRCGPWSATPAQGRRRSPATSPTPTRRAADHDPPHTTSPAGHGLRRWTSFPRP
jgi:hypothetical protein